MKILSNRVQHLFILSVILFVFKGCQEEIIPEKFYPNSDHENYEHSLKQANLLNSELGSSWQAMAKEALDHPIHISTPFLETIYLNPNKADAYGYRFSVKRGLKVMVEVHNHKEDSTVLFIDLYRIENDSLNQRKHVATANRYEQIIAFEPRRNADYLLRIQPELLRGGNFDVKIIYVPAFDFPVTGKNSRAIHSVFGDPRDGGKREHHGVDIFAKRHTPIIAPTEGRIRMAGTKGIGGRVVWLYDTKRNQSLYFAHLEKYLVEKNQNVHPGDTIGTVGNTGNAKNTPPHLHFGIYKNGPIDPYHFIVETDTATIKTSLTTSELGTWRRIKKQVLLKSDQGIEKGIDTLNQYQMVKIIGARKNDYRVSTYNNNGYVPGKFIEPIGKPLLQISDSLSYAILDAPLNTASIKGQTLSYDSIAILGIAQEYAFIRTQEGDTGWIKRGLDNQESSRKSFD